MRRLLLVTYYFPPLAGSGVFRPLRLAKYLPRFGWNVTVLTVDARVRVLKDQGLLSEVPAGVRVERTRTYEPRLLQLAMSRIGLRRLASWIGPWMMLPDEQRGWVPPAVHRGTALLKEQPYDVIVSTAGPYSAHLIGQRLQRRSGVAWIADFRDEWTTNPYLRDRYPTRWHLARNRAMERSVLSSADHVVCVSQPWLDALRGVAPELADDRCSVLPNGYDGEHFPDESPRVPDRFRIVYTGTFYGHRSPRVFLDAVERVLERGTIAADQLEIVLMGHGAARWTERLDASPAAAKRIRVVPQRPYREALDLLSDAAVLLLVVPREGGAGNHTGKLFPYLASGRPILTLAPEPNVAAELVRASGSGVVVPPDDPAAVAEGIEALYEDWRSGRSPARDASRIGCFEARRQAEDWSRLLDRVARPERPSSNAAESEPISRSERTSSE